jgi:hypothetical protein
VLRTSKRLKPANLVHCPSCERHEPFCYSRRHRPTPKNTLRGNPGCAVGPKTPTAGNGYPSGSGYLTDMIMGTNPYLRAYIDVGIDRVLSREYGFMNHKSVSCLLDCHLYLQGAMARLTCTHLAA